MPVRRRGGDLPRAAGARAAGARRRGQPDRRGARPSSAGRSASTSSWSPGRRPQPAAGDAALVVASHGRGEEPALTAALRLGVPYVGLIASRIRGAGGARLARRHRRAAQPGAQPGRAGHRRRGRAAEIALSVLAELVAERRAAERHAPRRRCPATAVDPVCGMTVAAVDSSPHVDRRRRRRPGSAAPAAGPPSSRTRPGMPLPPERLADAGRGARRAEEEVRPRIPDVAALAAALDDVDYLADPGLATALFLAVRLPQPLLLEGEPGVGKTEAAKALARVLDTPLYRLQCFEGIDAAEALYEWNHPRQLLGIRLAEARGAPLAEDDLFGAGVPAAPAAAAGDRAPGPAAGRAAARRDRPGRRRVRGVHLRGAGRGRGDRAGAGHHPGGPPAGRRPHLEPDPRPARRADPPLPLPLDRLPGARSGWPRSSAAGCPAAPSRWPSAAASAVTRLRVAGHGQAARASPRSIDWVAALSVLGLTRLDAAAVEATWGSVLKNRDDQELARARGRGLAGRCLSLPAVAPGPAGGRPDDGAAPGRAAGDRRSARPGWPGRCGWCRRSTARRCTGPAGSPWSPTAPSCRCSTRSSPRSSTGCSTPPTAAATRPRRRPIGSRAAHPAGAARPTGRSAPGTAPDGGAGDGRRRGRRRRGRRARGAAGRRLDRGAAAARRRSPTSPPTSSPACASWSGGWCSARPSGAAGGSGRPPRAATGWTCAAPSARRSAPAATRSGWCTPAGGPTPRRLVLLCDVSGSMEPYTRVYLTLLQGAVAGARAEAFVFSTRLTRLTRQLSVRDPDQALARAGATCVGLGRRHPAGRGHRPVRRRPRPPRPGPRRRRRRAVRRLGARTTPRRSPRRCAGCAGWRTGSSGSIRARPRRATRRWSAAWRPRCPTATRSSAGTASPRWSRSSPRCGTDLAGSERAAGRASAHRLLAVDRLPQDVGVPGVLGGLGDDVQEHPPGRPAGARLEPRRLRQRVVGVEVGQRRDEVVGVPRRPPRSRPARRPASRRAARCQLAGPRRRGPSCGSSPRPRPRRTAPSPPRSPPRA